MKGNLNFNFGTLANEIQVRVKINQFITLLLKQSDSLPIHREKVSMLTIWPVAYNLTYCAIEYIIEKPRKFACSQDFNTVDSFGYLFVT